MLVRMLGFMVLVALLALLVIVVLRAREGLGRRAAGRVGDPDARHVAAVEDARRELRRAEKRHDKRVRRARKAVGEAGRDPVLAKVGPVTLGTCTVTVRKRVHDLSPSTTFRVDVEGEIQQVVTEESGRPKVSRDDQREVYLTVTDDTWADVVKLGPDQLEGARRLEAAGAAAVRNLAAARQERDARLLAAQDELDRVRADTAEVDAARMTLEDVEGVGPRPIDVPSPPTAHEGDDGRAKGRAEDPDEDEDSDEDEGRDDDGPDEGTGRPSTG